MAFIDSRQPCGCRVICDSEEGTPFVHRDPDCRAAHTAQYDPGLDAVIVVSSDTTAVFSFTGVAVSGDPKTWSQQIRRRDGNSL